MSSLSPFDREWMYRTFFWSDRIQMSLTSDTAGLKLSGDEASPGNSKYYGTNASGVKGFHALGSGGGPGYSDEEAQDAVGTILVDSSTIDFTYSDATPSITASVIDQSITYAKLQNVSATARLLGRISSGAGVVEELTGTQLTTLLDAFTSTLKGLVPPSGGGTTTFLRADGTFAAPATGSSATYGTATLDFGSAPGTNMVTTTVTGQTSILAGSTLSAWLMAEATASHNAYEHMIVPIRLTCGNIVAGTGFDIVAQSDWRLTGTFTCRWMGNF